MYITTNNYYKSMDKFYSYLPNFEKLDDLLPWESVATVATLTTSMLFQGKNPYLELLKNETLFLLFFKTATLVGKVFQRKIYEETEEYQHKQAWGDITFPYPSIEDTFKKRKFIQNIHKILSAPHMNPTLADEAFKEACSYFIQATNQSTAYNDPHQRLYRPEESLTSPKSYMFEAFFFLPYLYRKLYHYRSSRNEQEALQWKKKFFIHDTIQYLWKEQYNGFMKEFKERFDIDKLKKRNPSFISWSVLHETLDQDFPERPDHFIPKIALHPQLQKL